MSHHTEFAKKRKHDAYVDEAEYQAQAQQQRVEDAYAARTKFLDILRDDRIVVPNDLTPRVLENVENLSQIDLDAAIEAGFGADPQILHPKLLRSVFFRSMDPYNSFLLAANVRREVDEGDLAKKMRMLHLAKNG